jgi:hypothetical protein
MPAASRGRVRAVQQWLAERADTPVERLALQWFRRYFEASQNSACAATVYTFFSVGPLLLAAAGVLHATGSDTNAFVRRLIEHQHLTGETAHLVRATFGTANNNALAASATAVIGFLLWGSGSGRSTKTSTPERGASRSGRCPTRPASRLVRRPRRRPRSVHRLRGNAEARRMGSRRRGLAGRRDRVLVVDASPLAARPDRAAAALSRRALCLAAHRRATATSPIFLGRSLSSDGRHFGPFGVVGALLGRAFVLATISVVCAVFSPVWAEWRKSEQRAAGDRRAIDGG